MFPLTASILEFIIEIKEIYVTTQNKTAQPGTGTHPEVRKELERNQKGKTGGRKKSLKSSCPLSCIK
jgi:hypothetical protein